jgi:hypothetical protein
VKSFIKPVLYLALGVGWLAVGIQAQAQPRATFGAFNAGVSFEQASQYADWALRVRGFTRDANTTHDMTGFRGDVRATFGWTQIDGGVQVHLSVVGGNSQEFVYTEYVQMQSQFLNPTQPNAGGLSFPQTVARGQKFSVAYAVTAAQAQNGFIAMTYTDSANWRGRFSYEYLRGSVSGTIELNAPATPGTYHIRLYTAEDDSQPVQVYQIVVQ